MSAGRAAWRQARRHVRRTAVFVAGVAVIVAGVAMLVLPGPGALVIVGGLSILALEFAWAARLRDRAKEKAVAASRAAGASAGKLVRRRNAT